MSSRQYQLSFNISKKSIFIAMGCIAVALIGMFVLQTVSLFSRDSSVILYREAGLVQYKPSDADDSEFSEVSGDENVLRSNTTVRTVNAYAHLLFPDSSLMSLDSNAVVDVEFISDAKTVLVQLAGNTWHRVKEVSDPADDRYQVYTPNAIAAVRGTEFGVSVDKKEDGTFTSRIFLIDGEVEVTDKKTQKKRTIAPGEMITLDESVEVEGELQPEPITEDLLNSQYYQRNSTISSEVLNNTKSADRDTFMAEVRRNRQLLQLTRVYAKIRAGEGTGETIAGISDDLKLKLEARINARLIDQEKVIEDTSTQEVVAQIDSRLNTIRRANTSTSETTPNTTIPPESSSTETGAPIQPGNEGVGDTKFDDSAEKDAIFNEKVNRVEQLVAKLQTLRDERDEITSEVEKIGPTQVKIDEYNKLVVENRKCHNAVQGYLNSGTYITPEILTTITSQLECPESLISIISQPEYSTNQVHAELSSIRNTNWRIISIEIPKLQTELDGYISLKALRENYDNQIVKIEAEIEMLLDELDKATSNPQEAQEVRQEVQTNVQNILVG